MAATTVLHDDRDVVLADADWQDGAVWINADDLPRASGFELKPEGACLGDLCIPLRGKLDVLQGAGRTTRINLLAFAELLHQAAVSDADARVISLGSVPSVRAAFTDAAEAPEFELVDRQGEPVSLSKFPDKKVILMTWASW